MGQGAVPAAGRHAVLVVDVAEHSDGRRVMALAQSYMPAQQIHVLDNPASPGSPWYAVVPGEKLATPEWSFEPGAARRFRSVDVNCRR